MVWCSKETENERKFHSVCRNETGYLEQALAKVGRLT